VAVAAKEKENPAVKICWDDNPRYEETSNSLHSRQESTQKLLYNKKESALEANSITLRKAVQSEGNWGRDEIVLFFIINFLITNFFEVL